MSTLRDIIKDAMRLIGVVQPGEEPTQAQIEAALPLVRELIDGWSNDRLLIHKVQPYYFPVQAGKDTYTLGPGADWELVRPMTMLKAKWILPTAVPTPTPPPPPPGPPQPRYLQLSQAWLSAAPAWFLLRAGAGQTYEADYLNFINVDLFGQPAEQFGGTFDTSIVASGATVTETNASYEFAPPQATIGTAAVFNEGTCAYFEVEILSGAAGNTDNIFVGLWQEESGQFNPDAQFGGGYLAAVRGNGESKSDNENSWSMSSSGFTVGDVIGIVCDIDGMFRAWVFVNGEFYDLFFADYGPANIIVGTVTP